MNVVIVGSSSGYPYVSYIGSAQGIEQEIKQAYQNCVDCMLQSEEHEREDIVTEVTVIYNGEIHEFLPEKQLNDFFKTI